METQIHPLDIQAIAQGDVISVEQIESITQCKCGTSEYVYALQELRVRIEKERRAIGMPVTLKQRNWSLVVCTPSDQLRVAKNRSREAARKLRKTKTILVETDVSGLTEHELKAHEQLLLNTGARIAVTSAASIRRIVTNAKPTDEFAAIKHKLLSKGKRRRSNEVVSNTE